MRKILEIRGEEVTYVVRGKLAFPSWDQNLWRSTTRDAFAREVKAQVHAIGEPSKRTEITLARHHARGGLGDFRGVIAVGVSVLDERSPCYRCCARARPVRSIAADETSAWSAMASSAFERLWKPV